MKIERMTGALGYGRDTRLRIVTVSEGIVVGSHGVRGAVFEEYTLLKGNIVGHVDPGTAALVRAGTPLRFSDVFEKH